MGGETKAKDGSTTGSGGKNDYQMETEGGKWELERNDPKEVQEQLKAGDADAAKTNMAVEKEDPDYKPPADA